MKHSVQMTAARLLLAAATAAMASCGDIADTQTVGTQTADVTTAAVTEADENRVSDDLPEMECGGKTVSILIREEIGYEFDTEQTGDLMDDIVYERNRAVSERFNLTLDYINQPGLWADKASYQALITNTVLAGDSTYDIVTGQSNIVLPLATEGIYLDMADAQYIDYSKP